METQEKKIINYMRKHGGITRFDGFKKEVGIANIPARIYDLRQKGWVIDYEKIKTEHSWYARYYIVKGVEE